MVNTHMCLKFAVHFCTAVKQAKSYTVSYESDKYVILCTCLIVINLEVLHIHSLWKHFHILKFSCLCYSPD